MKTIVETLWGLFRRLLKRRGTQRVRREIRAAHEIRQRYGAVLEKLATQRLKLETDLPVPKETIKAALRLAVLDELAAGRLDMRTDRGITVRDLYIVGYASLADFLPGDRAGLVARINAFSEFIETRGGEIIAGEKVDSRTLAGEIANTISRDELEQESEITRNFATLADEFKTYLARAEDAWRAR